MIILKLKFNSKSRSLFLLTSYLLLLTSFFSGCIRLTGNAGYWKKSADDEAIQGKSVNLDSDDLLYPGRAKGSITT